MSQIPNYHRVFLDSLLNLMRKQCKQCKVPLLNWVVLLVCLAEGEVVQVLLVCARIFQRVQSASAQVQIGDLLERRLENFGCETFEGPTQELQPG